MADILHQLSINVSPERVYEAITQQEGLANWWTQDTVAEAKIGTVAEFGFKDREVVFKMRIDLLEANRKVMWQCLGAPLNGKIRRCVLASPETRTERSCVSAIPVGNQPRAYLLSAITIGDTI